MNLYLGTNSGPGIIWLVLDTIYNKLWVVWYDFKSLFLHCKVFIGINLKDRLENDWLVLVGLYNDNDYTQRRLGISL